MTMKKCDYCGAEGCAPNVRGTKVAAVTIGNYRASADIDVQICERCADAIMADALRAMLGKLGNAEVDK